MPTNPQTLDEIYRYIIVNDLQAPNPPDVTLGTLLLAMGAAIGDGSGVPWFNVLDYATIQDAVTAAGVGGRVLFPPTQTPYPVAAELVPLNYQTWDLTGATLQRTAASTTRLIQCSGVTAFDTINGTFDGNEANNSKACGELVNISLGSLCTMSNATIINALAADAALSCLSSTYCLFTNTTINNCGYGYQVGSGGALGGSSNSCIYTGGTITDITGGNAIFMTGDIGSGASPLAIYKHIVSNVSIVGFFDTAVEIGEGCNQCVVSGITVDGLTTGKNGVLFRDNYDCVLGDFTIANVASSTGGAASGYGGVTFLGLHGVGQHRPKVSNGTITNCGNGVRMGDTSTVTAAFSNVSVASCYANGWDLVGNGLSLASCHAWHNYGDGFQTGTSGGPLLNSTLVGCLSTGNGQGGGTNYGFNVANPSTAGVAHSACIATDDQGGSNTQAYGFYYNQGSFVTYDNACLATSNKSGTWTGNNVLGALGTHNLFQQPSGLSTVIGSKTSNYLLTAFDGTVVFNGASLTATLPAIGAAVAGRVYYLINLNSTALTVAATGSPTINAPTSIPQNSSGGYQTDGTSWFSVGSSAW